MHVWERLLVCVCVCIHVPSNSTDFAMLRFGCSTTTTNVCASKAVIAGKPTGRGVPARGAPEREPPAAAGPSGCAGPRWEPLGCCRSAVAAAGRCAEAPLSSFPRSGRREARAALLSPPLPPGLAVWRGGGRRGGLRAGCGSAAAARRPRLLEAKRGCLRLPERPSPRRRVAGSCFSCCSN